MALPFTDPSQFVTYDGPNGPIAIPSQFASSFQLPQPSAPPPMVTAPPATGTPTGPLQTFDAAELAPPPAPAAPQPTDPVTPVPSAFTPAAPAAEPNAFITPEEASQLPIPAAPKQKAQAPATPPTAIELAMAANRNRQQIAQARGDVESRAAQAEEQIYKDSDKREAALEAAREAERQKEAKEREKARAEAREAADRAANYKIDENRRWNNLGTGRKLLAGVGVIMAGLGNALAKKGDARNPALDFIMETLKEDTRLQMDERAQLQGTAQEKKNYLSELRSQFSDNEAAFQASLAANTKFVANKLRTAAAGAKSETARLNALEGAELLEGEAAQLLDRAEEREHARKMADRNYRLAAAGQALQNRKFDREKFESDRAFDEGKRRFDVEAGLRADEATAKAAKARADGNEAEAKRLEKEAEKAKKEADEVRNLSIGAGSRKVTTGPDGQPFVEYEPLKQKDGTVYKAPDKLAEPLQKKKASVDNLVQLMDDTVNLMDRYGYEPDVAKTEAWQQMQANWAAMAIDEKTIAELGVLAGPDMGLIAKKLGTGDPTSFIDQTPGIRKARQNTLNKLDSDLRAAGYNGPKYNIPELTKQGVADEARNTAVGDLNKRAQATESGQSFSPRVVARNISEAAQGKRTQFDTSASAPTKDAEAAIDGLFAVALNGTAGSQVTARRSLQMLMNDKSPGIRALVRAKAAAMPNAGVQVPEK